MKLEKKKMKLNENKGGIGRKKKVKGLN